MEVDTASSVAQASSKHLSAELEIYCYFIVLLFLVDQNKYNEVIVVVASCVLFFLSFFPVFKFCSLRLKLVLQQALLVLRT